VETYFFFLYISDYSQNLPPKFRIRVKEITKYIDYQCFMFQLHRIFSAVIEVYNKMGFSLPLSADRSNIAF
jgi:hypothetical protein